MFQCLREIITEISKAAKQKSIFNLERVLLPNHDRSSWYANKPAFGRQKQEACHIALVSRSQKDWQEQAQAVFHWELLEYSSRVAICVLEDLSGFEILAVDSN
jgi:hypothetical protein